MFHFLAKLTSERCFFSFTEENNSSDLEERNDEGSEFCFFFFVAIFLAKYSS